MTIESHTTIVWVLFTTPSGTQNGMWNIQHSIISNQMELELTEMQIKTFVVCVVIKMLNM